MASAHGHGRGFDPVQTFGRDLEEQAQHVVHHARIFGHQAIGEDSFERT